MTRRGIAQGGEFGNCGLSRDKDCVAAMGRTGGCARNEVNVVSGVHSSKRG